MSIAAFVKGKRDGALLPSVTIRDISQAGARIRAGACWSENQTTGYLASERARIDKGYCSPISRVEERKPFGMKLQPVRRKKRFWVRVERIAEDRMADLGHVDSQLMRTAAMRMQGQAGDADIAGGSPPSFHYPFG